jgi:translation initiation factor IF-2
MDELLETLLTIAELNEYKSESELALRRGSASKPNSMVLKGVMAKLVVQTGTLKVGDVLVCGSAYGRIKAIYDTLETQSLASSQLDPPCR